MFGHLLPTSKPGDSFSTSRGGSFSKHRPEHQGFPLWRARISPFAYMLMQTNSTAWLLFGNRDPGPLPVWSPGNRRTDRSPRKGGLAGGARRRLTTWLYSQQPEQESMKTCRGCALSIPGHPRAPRQASSKQPALQATRTPCQTCPHGVDVPFREEGWAPLHNVMVTTRTTVDQRWTYSG